MTDLLVQISPDTDAKKPSVLPIHIITENEGQQNVNVTVTPDKHPATPPMAQVQSEGAARAGPLRVSFDSPKGPVEPLKAEVKTQGRKRPSLPKGPKIPHHSRPEPTHHREAFKMSANRKKVSEVTAAAAAAARSKKPTSAPVMNSVQNFLAKHPEFADEFSYTIPTSPASSPYSSPASSGSDKKAKKVSKIVRPMPEAKIHKVHDLPPQEEEEEEEEQLTSEEEVTEEEEEKEKVVSPRVHKYKWEGEDTEEEEEEEKDDEEPKDDKDGKDWSSDIEDSIEHEKDVFGSRKKKKHSSEEEDEDVDDEEEEEEEEEGDKEKPSKSDKKKAKPPTEEEEALEKMELIEDIKEGARIGFMPSQEPSFNMPINVLRQIKRFQDEKAAEAINIGYMGTGLVGIVNLIETLNGRFDPIQKIFGTPGLRLQGAKDNIENNIQLYKVPFTKLYRRLRKNGMGGEMPPWLQIILITGGIMAETHKINLMREMEENARKEERDPVAMRKAREMLIREQQMRQARMRDATPYHVEMEQQGAPQMTDAQMEAMMEKEFSGFDKLPTLDSLKSVGPAAPPVATPPADKDVTTPSKETTAKPADTKPKDENAPIKFVHDVPKDSEDIHLTHEDDPEDVDENEEDDAEEYESDSASAPVIQIPVIGAKKQAKN